MKKSVKSLLIGCFAVGLGAGYFLVPEYKYRRDAVVLRDTTIRLRPNSRIDSLAAELERGGIVASGQGIVDAHARRLPQSIKAGNYRLTAGMPMRQLLSTLVYGRQTPVRVTFNNVRTVADLAGRVSRYTMADSVALLSAFTSDSVMKSHKMNRQTIPALFLPNTYEVYWTITPEEFTSKMAGEYDKFWNSERLEKAQKLGFSPLEITTIASIVSQETNVWDEMTDVGGVYINRLRAKMPLQADPTVKFAIGDFGLKRILNKHLEVNSPYNTYKNAGLPPGPICIVDGRVIDKVLDYKGHKYYYFCANVDFSGRHAFATNLSQHNRNAQAYHQELNRRGIRK